jgi:N-hydroxyarylamine O-acetyltransferase
MSEIGPYRFDLDAYCARIDYAGPREPSLAVLRELHRLHPAAIPFEAIDVLLGRPISLEAADVDAKLIAGRRGGYCFEQNTLFRRALIAMGFEASALIARSRWGAAGEEPRPRTHMALRVMLDGEAWLADVGFSTVTLTAPLRMAVRAPQATLCEPARLTPVADELRHEVEFGGTWRAVYDIAASAPLDIDLEAANWFTSTHPNSLFRQVLIVSRAGPEARYLLTFNRLTVRRPGVETERRRLSADALAACLERDFGMSPEPAWPAVLERAVADGDAMERRG